MSQLLRRGKGIALMVDDDDDDNNRDVGSMMGY
jgi:hypothetical protein